MKARKLAALLNTRYIVHDGGETINIGSDRVLKEGEVAVPKKALDEIAEWAINAGECIDSYMTSIHMIVNESKARKLVDALLSQRPAEGGAG